MIFFIPLFLFSLFFSWPYVTFLIRKEVKNDGLSLLTFSFAFSLGFLTLLLFYLGVFLKSFFEVKFIIIFILLLYISGLIFLRKKYKVKLIFLDRNDILFVIIIFAPLLLILFNTLYYPFIEWDAISNYSYVAKKIFQFKGLDGFNIPGIKGGFITSYPLLLPLSYTYIYLLSSQVNEHLAKIIPFLLALFTLIATYLLGKAYTNKKVGLLAATLYSFTPIFTIWAPSGYTDIPCSFFATLSFYSFYLLKTKQKQIFAYLCGIMIGLATWTKSSAIPILISFPLFSLLYILLSRNKKEIFLELKNLLIIFSCVLVISGPWYLKNYLFYGYITPPISGAFYNLDRSLINLLLPFITNVTLFTRLLGAIYSIGLIFFFLTFFKIKRTNLAYKSILFLYVGLTIIIFELLSKIFFYKKVVKFDYFLFLTALTLILIYLLSMKFKLKIIYVDKKSLLFLSFTLPLLFIWWFKFSYDARFILPILSIYIIIAADFLVMLYDLHLKKNFYIIPTIILVLCLTILENPSFREAVNFFPKIKIKNILNDDQKRIEKIGDSYKVLIYVRNLIKKDKTIRVYTLDNRWLNFLGDEFTQEGYPTKIEELKNFRYFLLTPWAKDEYRYNKQANNEIIQNLDNSHYFLKEYQQGDFILYKIMHQTVRDKIQQ